MYSICALLSVCYSYVVCGAVRLVVLKNSHDEGEVLLICVQGLVVEAVVILLVPQGEGGGQ